jgi:CheY-like chemotaxis protein
MAIRLNAEAMQARPDWTDEERGRRVASILRTVDAMTRLIDDLLDLAQIDAGRLALDRDRINARTLRGELLELWRPLATQKGVTLDVRFPDEPLRVDADRDRVLQVFSNLLGNALKFTPPGGRIEVSAEHRDGVASFAVRDTGVGIEPDALAHIFERYWQARNAPRGAGLGLFIAKGIVEAHGGEIVVDSIAGEGTTVTFNLPLTPFARSSSAAANGRVIVVDDDKAVREAVAETLSAQRIACATMSNGREVLQYLESGRPTPSLILLDLRMPDMDGWQLVEELKKDARHAAIPLVVMSAAADLDLEAASLGAARWLKKPVAAEALLRAVDDELVRAALR